MTKRKPTVTHRTAERLHRAAYEFEYLASRMRQAGGWEGEAEGIREISSRLGDIARRMDRKLGVSQ